MMQNSIEATRQATTADNQMKRIDEMGQITAAMKVNADVVKQLRQSVLALTSDCKP
jgi:hypothetical protein